ncbi:50S ribosomal protein L15e, partial [Candidatus Woesearchaeota archaeon]|nr:50S ribosomal protein L15e [Candidatus Woesearchaeota archaeon]
LISWRKENATVRVEHPTRPDRAHSLGYKAKQGVFVVRQRVQRGGRKREVMDGGRRSKRSSLRLNLNKNYQQVAEERAQKSYINCVVLNSYWVGQDGKNIWYEIVMVDPGCPVVQSDKQLSWTMDKAHQGRAHRGLTSAGRKARGLRNKGKGAEKLRPSKGASWRRKANSWGKFF